MTKRRFIDRRVHVVQGDHSVSVREPGTMITTVLGSCIAACFRDPETGIGGMNHFLLPGGGDGNDIRYGVQAMEVLVNSLLAVGAERATLEVRLFGGARMLAGVNDIGSRNIQFATEFVKDEGFKHVGGSLGGDSARRIQFWPYDGFARQALVNAEEAPEVVAKPAPRPQAQDDGELELF